MGVTSIPWTHFTHNLWWGCARVSPGCAGCYAADLATYRGRPGLWRRNGPRWFLSARHRAKPCTWERAAAAGDPHRLVFCGSMFDLFERHGVADIAARQDEYRADLWRVIEETPHLVWQLLTKRVEEVAEMVPWGDAWPANVWIGTSVEDQQRAEERLDVLNELPARVRFASVEPQLERVDLSRWLAQPERQGVDWVVVGGESHGKRRRFDLAWARDLREQVADSTAAYFFKQTGTVLARELGLTTKGEQLEELPGDLRIRNFPAAYEPAA